MAWGSSEFGSIATVFLLYVFENICHTVIWLFNALLYSVLNLWWILWQIKKCHPSLSHRTDEVVLSTNYFMQITYMLNRVFQRVEQLISPSETTCFPGELLVSHGEIRSSIRQAPLFLSRMRKIKSIRFENLMINGKVMSAWYAQRAPMV